MNNKLFKDRFALFLSAVLLLQGTSCSVFRPGTTSGSGPNTGERPLPENQASGDTRFLNTISTGNASDYPAPAATSGSRNSGSSRDDRSRADNGSLYRVKDKDKRDPASAAPLSVLQLKYSMLTNTPVE